MYDLRSNCTSLSSITIINKSWNSTGYQVGVNGQKILLIFAWTRCPVKTFNLSKINPVPFERSLHRWIRCQWYLRLPGHKVKYKVEESRSSEDYPDSWENLSRRTKVLDLKRFCIQIKSFVGEHQKESLGSNVPGSSRLYKLLLYVFTLNSQNLVFWDCLVPRYAYEHIYSTNTRSVTSEPKSIRRPL